MFDSNVFTPRILRVFQVAKSLQITTSDLLQFLADSGYDISRQAMQPVSEEMFLDVLKRFKPDLAAEYERLRAANPQPISEQVKNWLASRPALPEPLPQSPVPSSSEEDVVSDSGTASLQAVAERMDESNPWAALARHWTVIRPVQDAGKSFWLEKFIESGSIFADQAPKVQPASRPVPEKPRRHVVIAPKAPVPKSRPRPATLRELVPDLRIPPVTDAAAEPAAPSTAPEPISEPRAGEVQPPEPRPAESAGGRMPVQTRVVVRSKIDPKVPGPNLSDLDLELIRRIVKLSISQKLRLIERLAPEMSDESRV